MAKLTVVVGGQYGSEGKGAIAGYLGRDMGKDAMAVRVAGPNAGHTVIGSKGREWKLRAVPVAAVTSRDCQLHVAAGSEIDLDVFSQELALLDDAGHRASARMTVHPSATILTPSHIAQEQVSGIINRIGSTGKGIGAARAERIARTCLTAGEVPWLKSYLSEPGPLDLGDLEHVVIEGTQGYGLGLHTTHYPQVTSSDCRAVDFVAMAGVSPWHPDVSDFQVIVVARAFPIRVAGNSGPLLDETSWQTLGLPEERTTVTNKIRRVGAFDSELLREAIHANGGGQWSSTVQLAITMLDHRFPETKDQTEGAWDDAPRLWLQEVQDDMETDVLYVGTGPNTISEPLL